MVGPHNQRADFFDCRQPLPEKKLFVRKGGDPERCRVGDTIFGSVAWSTVVQHGTSFTNRRTQILLAIFGFGLALALLGAAAGSHGAGAKVSAGVLGVACALIGVQALLTNRLDVGTSGVKVRSMLRTRFFPYRELSAAEAIERPIGAYRRVCVRLVFPSGAHFDVTAVNESRTNRGTIERAAALVNERIRQDGQAPIS